MEFRKLNQEEVSLIPDLYLRTWEKPRTSNQQNWLLENPLGPPQYWGAFLKDQQLVGLTGLLSWALGEPGAMELSWQLGEVMVDKNHRGQKIFRKILTKLVNDLNTSPLPGPLYTLPNAASTQELRECSLFSDEEQIPRHTLWLKPESSPLKKLGPLSHVFKFLLPQIPKNTQTTVFENTQIGQKPFSSFKTDESFLTWRFLNSSTPWIIWKHQEEVFVWQEKDKNVQIGLWPQDLQACSQAFNQLLNLAREKKWNRIEWAGQADSEMNNWLFSAGFRTQFLTRPTWHNTLLKSQQDLPRITRVQFDT